MLTVNPFAGPTPPSPGSVGIGELLTDANTRRMWLGVAAATNPAQALLIGDIVALQNEDADIRADFTALLGTGLDGKSNVGHHHTASEIDDFSQAVINVVGGGAGIPTGCIIMYSGALANIGVGSLAGFVLCDGRNGTPNLVDKFVFGAGTVAVGSTGGDKNISGLTDPGGTHSHGGATGWTALTVAQMPHHAHGVADPGHAHYSGSLSHNHNYTRYSQLTTVALLGSGAAGSIWQGTKTDINSESVNPARNTDWGYTGIGIHGEGGNGAHYHTIGADGYHQHVVNISGGNLPPYVALAYIMKT